MTEYIKQNEHQINNIARSAQEALGQKPDSEFLYSLQLMQKGLLRENFQLMPGNRVDFLEMVEDLLADDPEQAMKYLLETDQPGELVGLPEGKLAPNELAQELLAFCTSKWQQH